MDDFDDLAEDETPPQEPVGARVEYRSNNSGGGWWLTDKNWLDLEKAGWEVEWVKDRRGGMATFRDKDGVRWLGALATTAVRRGLNLHDAIEEFVKITGQDMNNAGCGCCGQPHSFTEYDANDKYVADGPSFTTSASW